MGEAARVASFEAAESLGPLLDAVGAGDTRRAAGCLRELPKNIAAQLPGEWIEANAAALERNDYDPLSGPFHRQQFIGPDGHFLIVAPYLARGSAGDTIKLSVLFAQLIKLPRTQGLIEGIEAVQYAKVQEEFVYTHPIRTLAKLGNVHPTLNFIVPDNWGWRDSSLGPLFYDFAGEREAAHEIGRKVIRRIFDADSADSILAPFDAKSPIEDLDALFYRTIEFHDAGHSSGIGLRRKDKEGWINGYWSRGVEEWRADSIGFELESRILTPEQAAADMAVNVTLRFGQWVPFVPDADGPTEHTTCIMLMLDRLLREGNVVVRGDRLGLRDPSPVGLVRAMEPQRHECIALTKSELALDQQCGVMRLYGSVALHRATIAVYQAMMHNPTKELVGT